WCSFLCHNACCNKKLSSFGARWCESGVQKFQSANSRTYRKNGTSFNVDWYVNPVDGFLGVDKLTLGDSLTIPAATFGQATAAIFDEESQNAKIYDGFL
ncbi:aspartic protease, partial [Aphelenchoides avenae]